MNLLPTLCRAERPAPLHPLYSGLAESPINALSDRELEVFGLLGKGMATRQVADNMHVSIKTVQAYCAPIKQKLYLSTATQLLREAIHWHDPNSEGAV